jgi:hypothetical protein
MSTTPKASTTTPTASTTTPTGPTVESVISTLKSNLTPKVYATVMNDVTNVVTNFMAKASTQVGGSRKKYTYKKKRSSKGRHSRRR